MDLYRIWHSLRLIIISNPEKRAAYIKKHNIFRFCGDNCMFMFRKLPLYSHCIKCHNNVRIASNVTLCTHDAIHNMLNNVARKEIYIERIGCIEILDNVFIGANSTVLYDTKIGPNVIVGANSFVNKDIANGVFAGAPAKYLCSIVEYRNKLMEKQKAFEVIAGQDKISTLWEIFERNHGNF